MLTTLRFKKIFFYLHQWCTTFSKLRAPRNTSFGKFSFFLWNAYVLDHFSSKKLLNFGPPKGISSESCRLKKINRENFPWMIEFPKNYENFMMDKKWTSLLSLVRLHAKFLFSVLLTVGQQNRRIENEF